MPIGVNSAAVQRRAQVYPGFDKIGQLFTFGDSYSQTGFEPADGAQPSAENPIGNPELPGDTSANGPNWIDYLTVEYNQSTLLTYNFAYSGATVAKSVVDSTVDVSSQVHDQYLPVYGSGSESKYPDPTNAEILKAYSGLVEELYRSGARNFFFLNVPPIDRSPLVLELGEDHQKLQAEDISSYNKGVFELATNLSNNHQDTTVFYYDTNTLFSDVLDDPSKYPETALYKSTTKYCEKYESGTPSPDTFYEECGFPANEYFWKDSLHPTDPIHKALAKGLASMLEKGDSV
ncbi:hypothetical protein FQN54_006959 [Arachnomyces sp. PD_36]|nr:hypothetical protein FQN54_006959 [Arachnomyces sp. PD_36]